MCYLHDENLHSRLHIPKARLRKGTIYIAYYRAEQYVFILQYYKADCELEQ